MVAGTDVTPAWCGMSGRAGGAAAEAARGVHAALPVCVARGGALGVGAAIVGAAAGAVLGATAAAERARTYGIYFTLRAHLASLTLHAVATRRTRQLFGPVQKSPQHCRALAAAGSVGILARASAEV